MSRHIHLHFGIAEATGDRSLHVHLRHPGRNRDAGLIGTIGAKGVLKAAAAPEKSSLLSSVKAGGKK